MLPRAATLRTPPHHHIMIACAAEQTRTRTAVNRSSAECRLQASLAGQEAHSDMSHVNSLADICDAYDNPTQAHHMHVPIRRVPSRSSPRADHEGGVGHTGLSVATGPPDGGSQSGNVLAGLDSASRSTLFDAMGRPVPLPQALSVVQVRQLLLRCTACTLQPIVCGKTLNVAINNPAAAHVHAELSCPSSWKVANRKRRAYRRWPRRR